MINGVVWSGRNAVHPYREIDRLIERSSGGIQGNALSQKIFPDYYSAVDDRGFVCFCCRARARLRHGPNLVTQMGLSLANVVASA